MVVEMSYPEKRRDSGAAVPPGYSVNVVRKLLHRGARANLARMFGKAYAVDAARTLTHLNEAERIRLFSILLADCDSAHAAAILSEMDSNEGLGLLQHLEPPQIASLLSEMPADDATSVASRLPEPLAAEVLALMEAQPAAGIRELLEHEAQTAGRIMTPDFFALEEEVTVSEAITALQRRSEDFEMVFYLYVVDKRNHLVGAVSLRRLLTTPQSTQLRRIMVTDVISARVDTDQEEVAKLVSQYNLLAIPVVDEEDRLVGIVTVDDVLDVVQEEATEDLLALAGVAAEERVTTKASRSLRLRAPWLLINLVTAFLASAVVKQFDTEIGLFPALAVLMPIVAGMGGNAATQTLTVIVRGIALGELTGAGRVIIRQSLVGIGNGLINGLVAAAVVSAFYNDLKLGVVLGLAMIVNMVVAGAAGTLIPLLLRRVGVDPAVASSVFVTTCTDVAGFFSFLGLATVFLGLIR
jgi:magnesium transporter